MMNDNDQRASLTSSVVMLIVLLMAAFLLITKVSVLRHAQRAESCQSNLKRIGVALHNYHMAYKVFPMGAGGTDGLGIKTNGNSFRLSGFVGLTPFVDQQVLWQKIARPYRIGEQTFPSMGPSLDFDPSIYKFWGFQVPMFLCPEEPVRSSEYGMRSYVFCNGDGVKNVGDADENERRVVSRGLFTRSLQYRMRDCLDGLSNTILVGETAVGTGDSFLTGNVAKNVPGLERSPALALGLIDPEERELYRVDVDVWEEGKGSRWADGSFRISGFTTVLPPNGPSATTPESEWGGIMSASSHHAEGAFLVMADGAVRFVSESIDTGDPTQNSVASEFGNMGAESPYGLWGALGTRSGRELISDPDKSLSNGPSPNPGSSSSQPADISELAERLDRIEQKLDRLIDQLGSGR